MRCEHSAPTSAVHNAYPSRDRPLFTLRASLRAACDSPAISIMTLMGDDASAIKRVRTKPHTWDDAQSKK